MSMRATWIRLRISLLLLSLASCTTGPPVGPFAPQDGSEYAHPDQALAYDCQNIDIVVALYPESLRLYLPDRTFDLPHIQSASGAHYSDGTASFWSKGDRAFLETPEGVSVECMIDRRRSIWDIARKRGVVFRAVGNEPGWHLEIGSDWSLLVLDYGNRIVTFPTPKPVNSGQKAMTVYQSLVEGQRLTIRLQSAQCNDTMADEHYPTRVTVEFAGRTYSGCGQPLD